MALCVLDHQFGDRLTSFDDDVLDSADGKRHLGGDSPDKPSGMPSEVMSVTGPNNPQEDPRMELGRFLRTRRERLTPEDLGFPTAGRRRTPGLRREEVAVAAGLSVTWYTYLEQGRGKDVSPGVLDSIARALHMSEDERIHMHRLMYGHDPQEAALADEVPVTGLLQNIVAATNDYQYPVFTVDRCANFIAWNPAAAKWYEDFSDIPPRERNIVHWIFGSPRATERLENWEEVARDILARWRADMAREPVDPKATALADQYKKKFPLFDKLWNEHIVLEHRVAVRHFRHPELGTCRMRMLPLFTVYKDMPGVYFHIPEHRLL